MFYKKCRNISALFFIIAVYSLLLVPVASQAGIEGQFGKKEVEIGQQAAEEIAKQSKLSTEEADLKRLRTIGDKLAQIANTTEFKANYGHAKITPFQYTFNIIEDKEINAFSLPGGFIYVNRGLLDFVQSDDELAAVLAHEVVHAAHHHMIYLLRQQSSLQTKTLWVLLASIFAGGMNSDTANLMMGTQLYSIAKLNDYGRDAERDADYGAVKYMLKASYNPVGMLTFLERLAMKPELIRLGIYQSHPENAERIKNVTKLLKELKIPIERWKTSSLAKIKVNTVNTGKTNEVQLLLNNTVILKPVATNQATAQERAIDMANKLETALQTNLQQYEIVADPKGTLRIRKQQVLAITKADAENTGKTPAQIVEYIQNTLRIMIWNQQMSTIQR